jgi:phosphate butyryltransferase
MIRDFEQLMNEAIKKGPKRLVVAAAGDREVLKAVKLAIDNKLVEAVLVDDRDIIKSVARDIDIDMNKVEIVNVSNKLEACEKAVQLLSSGQGDILMKGLIDTSIIMKAVLNKEFGLRSGELISHITMIESRVLKRLLFVTDGGINIKPSLEEKKDIIRNAVNVAIKLGYEKPKVAVIAAIEKINSAMPETIEAAALAKMSDRGQISGAIIDGPLAIDNALSEEAARIKGIESAVAGKADILLAPEIIAGNILGKSPIYFAGDRIATIIGGTSKPVVLTSRANTADIKLISIAATVLMA